MSDDHTFSANKIFGYLFLYTALEVAWGTAFDMPRWAIWSGLLFFALGSTSAITGGVLMIEVAPDACGLGREQACKVRPALLKSFLAHGSTPEFVIVELALFCDVARALARPGYPRAALTSDLKNSLAKLHIVVLCERTMPPRRSLYCSASVDKPRELISA